MRPDRRDFAEHGDLIEVNYRFGILSITIGNGRWSWDESPANYVESDSAVGIVVGTGPTDLPFDLNNDCDSPVTALYTAAVARYIVFPDFFAWHLHMELGVLVKHDGTRTHEDERHETHENNESVR